MRVRPENRNFRADVMRRMQPAFAQHVRRHRRRRRLAMHPGDDDPAFPAHDRRQRFGAAQQKFPARARTRQDRIVLS